MKIRRRNPSPLKAYCSPNERLVIEKIAQKTGLSVSKYLVRVGMGFVPPSSMDHEAVRQMTKVSGDLGRLGGLLKALLTNDERLDGYTGLQIQTLTLGVLKDIEAMKDTLKVKIDCLTDGTNGNGEKA
ncbi:MAG: conjugal transfer protein TraJ [Pseudomonadota bacterium]